MIRIGRRIPVIFLALGLLAPGAANHRAADRPVTGRDRPVGIPLHDYQGGLVTVPVRMAGREVPFIFDTAGGLTVISPDLARRAGLGTFGRVSGFRMNGERLDFPRCETATLRVGNLEIETDPVVFDLNSLLPEGWPELGGIVSLQTFENHVLTLDWDRSRLIVESNASLMERLDGMHEINARFARKVSGASIDIFVEVEAETGNLWMELDTGNAGPVLLAPHALRQLGIEGADEPEPWTGELPLSIPGLGILRAGCSRRELIYDGVLGLDAIRKLTWTLDMPGERVWAAIRAPETMPRPTAVR